MTEINQTQPPSDEGDESQFEDYQGELRVPDDVLVFSRLLTAPVLRGAAALFVGLFILSRPRSAGLFAVALGVFLIIWAAGETMDARRKGDRSWLDWLKVAGLLLVATVLVIWPDATKNVVGRIAGFALIGYALHEAYDRRRTRPEDRVVGLVGDALTAAVGVALVVIPNEVFNLVLLAIAMTWIIGGIAAMVTGLRPQTENVEVRSVWGTLLDWIEERPDTADDRRQLYAKLFFEGPLANRRLSRFFILMGFATVIAGYGIASDSTAVVVGAMLVAPLMTPLMATSVSIIMGWPKRAAMSAVVALGGIAFTVVLGWIIAGTVSFGLDPATNAQISSRITPTLVDLAIAVAAGGAGAFALSRPDVSDALPGVAVAIALVPPLAVTGMMLRETDYDAARGALLLFTTNGVAILLTGALVFVLTGVVPIRRLSHNSRWIRSIVSLVGVFAVAIIIALTLSSERLQASSFDQGTAEQAIVAWIGDNDLALVRTTVTPSKVTTVVSGPNPPPSVDDLGPSLAEALGRPVDVEVDWVPNQQFVYIAPG